MQLDNGLLKMSANAVVLVFGISLPTHVISIAVSLNIQLVRVLLMDVNASLDINGKMTYAC